MALMLLIGGPKSVGPEQGKPILFDIFKLNYRLMFDYT